MLDQKHIKGCIDGDRLSQKTLYDTYSGQMYSVCLRYCSDQMTAADALQIGFVKVFQNLHSFKNDGELFYWIRKIIVRCCIDEIRKRKKLKFEAIENTDQSLFSYDMPLDFDLQNYQQMLKLIDTLPDGYKAVFSMHVLDDMSHKEIGEILNITESTSRTQLFKSRKLLQAMMLKSHPSIAKNYIK